MKSLASRYGAALLAVAVAMGVRLLLDPLLGDRAPFLILFFAVGFAAWWGGRGPAILAVVTGAIGTAFFLLPPRYSLTIHHPEYQVGLVVYVVVGILLAEMFESLRKAQREAEQKQQELAQEVLSRQTAERIIAEREELLRITFASIGDGVITTDPQGNVESMNAVSQVLTGWTQQEAQGQPLTRIFKIINEQSRLTVENPVQKALREGRIVGLANHTILISKQGTERSIDDSAAPIRDTQGRILGVVLIFRDISDRREAEARLALNEERFRLAAEAMNGIIYEYNFHTDHVERTRGLYEVLGYHPHEVPSTSQWWWDQMHPDDRQHSQPTLEAAAQSWRNVVNEYRVKHRDGRWLDVVDRALILKDPQGVPAKIIGCTVDVTQERAVERERNQFLATLNGLVTSAPLGIAVLDDAMRFRLINQPLAEMNGLSCEAHLGRSLQEIVPQLYPQVEPLFRQVMETGQKITDFILEGETAKTPGVLRIWRESWFPITSDEGTAKRVGVVVQEITEQRKIRQQLQYQLELNKSITDNATTAIFMMNGRGQCTFMNPAAEKMTGFQFSEVAHRLLHDVIHHHHPDGQTFPVQECALDRALLAQMDLGNHEDVFIRKDGSFFPVVVTATQIQQNNIPLGMVMEVRDVTEEQKSDQRIHTLLSELQDADRRKDEFLAILAHELRNPLAPVKNALEIMKLLGDSPTAVAEARSLMDRQIGQMARLIDDLLDVSRITRDNLKLKRETVSLAAVVEHAVEACRPSCEQAGHTLEVVLPPEPVFLNADSARLAQVLGNLLMNSCKYTERGGHISLAASCEDNQLVVKVTDSGIGIPPEMLPKVFDLFTQVNNSIERAAGGLGIGLSLVKRLVELHGGTVTASSAGVGQGSEFVVRLPFLPQVPPAPIAPPPAAPALPSCRILVVDDNRDSAQTLSMLLKMLGNETRTAYDGLEAVEQAEQFQPDLIFLDIGLPKIDGYEACRRIRELPTGKKIFIIALTGWGQEDDIRQAKTAGFNHHCTKPIDQTTIIKILAAHASQRESLA